MSSSRVAVAVLLAALAMASCSSGPRKDSGIPPVPEFIADPRDAVEDPAPLPGIEEVLRSSAAMQAFLRQEVLPLRSRLQRMRQLSRLLLSPDQLGIRYEAELTLSAAETFRQRAGNCLSFSALYVALAREAGLDASFQDVPVLPNWRLDAGAFVVERHINVVVRMHSGDYVIDFRPPAAAAYARAVRISDRNAVAQYFGNLGVARFATGDLGGAYRYFRRGLEADPGAAALWVNLGVALGRNGQLDAAELCHETALSLEPGNLSALSNLAGVAEAQGDAQRSQQLLRRINGYRNRNPYYQYWIGETLLQEDKPAEALEVFRRALRLLPAEADFHFALARTWRALGRESEARRSYAEALALAASESIRRRYTATFEAPAAGALQD